MAELVYDKDGRLIYTKEMNDEGYKILVPMMMPVHFGILMDAFRHEGYNVELLDTDGPDIAQTGLKYVHNDTCYPALLVIGQLINALESGKYDLNKTALMITQTGGGCRASNYIHLLRKGLKKAGLEQIPVISLNLSGLEKNPGFKISLRLIRRVIAGLVYGDVLMTLRNQTKPYEVNKGESEKLVLKWQTGLAKDFNEGKSYRFKEMEGILDKMCSEFAQIERTNEKKIRVGVVGEIYVKYARLGNNDLEQFLFDQGCEICLPGVMGFAAFKIDNRIEDIKLYGGSTAKRKVCEFLLNYVSKTEDLMIAATSKYGFQPPSKYAHTKSLIDGVIGFGSKMGEGWLLTAEMLELAETGFENIVCTQPFGCLPNHINGKGMVRKIKEINPKANIVAIDYDPGAPRVNQENRIKLMLAVAREELENRYKDKSAPANSKQTVAK
ncbi:MAG: 2-hydroxyacyl-CoA dehydratase [Ruminococcus sp.]|nr:2-hydroxyacyl-CoA dehydratase [Ruminococcus sp.]